MRSLSLLQWELAEEVERDLLACAEMLCHMKSDVLIVNLIKTWAQGLCLLAWETFSASSLLVKTGKLRAAYGIGRTILDCYLRLNWYDKDIAKYPDLQFVMNAEQLPGASKQYFDTFAWQDWANMGDKAMWYAQKFPVPDIPTLSTEERDKVVSLFANQFDFRKTEIAKMFKAVIGTQAELGELRAEYGLRSGYLHGDQSALYEMYDFDEGGVGSDLSATSRSSEHRIIGSNIQLAILFLQGVGAATGRDYAWSVLAKKMMKVFSFKP